MLPDRVSNPGPLTYESGALPIALRGPATSVIRAFVTSKLGLPCSYMPPNRVFLLKKTPIAS